jgi:hypothetical protein
LKLLFEHRRRFVLMRLSRRLLKEVAERHKPSDPDLFGSATNWPSLGDFVPRPLTVNCVRSFRFRQDAVMTSFDQPDSSTPENPSVVMPQQLDSREADAPRSRADVLQDLDRLDELLSRATRELDDTEAERSSGEDRRRDERRDVFTEIVIVQPATTGNREYSKGITLVQGQTLNLSASGVAFVTPKPLVDDSLVALLRHPDFPAPQCCFELTLFRSRELADGQWEHGAVLRPLVPGSTLTAAVAGAPEV